MPTISLTSFMKILTKGTPQKVTEYSRYLTPGGYDFYWQLKDASHGLTVGGKSYADCAKPIQQSGRDIERKHNLDGLKSLSKWLGKKGLEEFFDAPAANCSSPGAYVTIKLEPEFGVVVNGKRQLVQLWNAKGSHLTRTAAGVGIYLLEKHLCINEFAGCKAVVVDLRKGTTFAADALPANIEPMVTSELAWLDSFFKIKSKAA